MSDRGEHFALYASFLDDPDVQALSDRAFRVLMNLKGALGAAGIGVLYDGIISERCQCTKEELQEIYTDLEQRKPSGDEGWIRRDRNVVWLVNSLRFSPSLKSKDKKHRAYIQRMLAPLGSRPIALEFRARYPEWFEGQQLPFEPPSKDQPRPIEGPSEGHQSPIEGSSEHKIILREEINKRSVDLGKEREPPVDADDLIAPASPPASPSVKPKAERPPRELPPGVQAFLRVCYDYAPGTTPSAVVAKVLDELRETLSPDGANLQGERVRAFNRAHLNDVCREVADKPPKKRHVGMHFVLLKLRDTYLEVKTAAEKPTPAKANGRGQPTAIADVVSSPAPTTSDAEIEAYFADPEHFAEAKQIQQDVEHQFRSWPKNDALVKTADAALKAALREAYESREEAHVAT